MRNVWVNLAGEWALMLIGPVFVVLFLIGCRYPVPSGTVYDLPDPQVQREPATQPIVDPELCWSV